MGLAFGLLSKVVIPALFTNTSMYPVSLVMMSTTICSSSWDVVLPWIGKMFPCSWAKSAMGYRMLTPSSMTESNGEPSCFLQFFEPSTRDIDLSAIALQRESDDKAQAGAAYVWLAFPLLSMIAKAIQTSCNHHHESRNVGQICAAVLRSHVGIAVNRGEDQTSSRRKR